jgi:hypothetical protein
MVFRISEALSRSKSVQSFHASDNPGLCNELKEMICYRIHASEPFVEEKTFF